MPMRESPLTPTLRQAENSVPKASVEMAAALPLGAEVHVAAAAVRADAATDREIDRDAITHGKLGHRRADGHHGACRLVAADKAAGGVAATHHGVAVVEAQVAAANTGCVHFDQHVLGPHFGNRDGTDFYLLVARQEDGLHVRHGISPVT